MARLGPFFILDNPGIALFLRVKKYVQGSTRKKVSNLLWLLLFFVILFTPLGTTLKIWVNRIVSFAPSITQADERSSLSSYNWMLRDFEGNTVNFNRFGDTVVLVNFWATWCPPCIAEMPSLQELYTSYGDRVTFLFVTSETPEVVAAFMQKHDYDLPVYFPVDAPPPELRSNSIPATYLISIDGSIVIDKTGAAQWNSPSVRSLLDDLIQEPR